MQDVRRRLPNDLSVPASSIDIALCDAESRVESILPDRYRKLLTRVEGEVLVFCACEGQLSEGVSLPAASNMVLFANLSGLYADRRVADEMDSSAWTLDEHGEIVTFSPGLAWGTRIVAYLRAGKEPRVGYVSENVLERPSGQSRVSETKSALPALHQPRVDSHGPRIAPVDRDDGLRIPCLPGVANPALRRFLLGAAERRSDPALSQVPVNRRP